MEMLRTKYKEKIITTKKNKMNSPFKQKFSDKSPLAQKKAIERFVYNPKSDELTERQRDS